MINIGLVSTAMAALSEEDRLDICTMEIASMFFENGGMTEYQTAQIIDQIREHYKDLVELQLRSDAQDALLFDFKKERRKRLKIIK